MYTETLEKVCIDDICHCDWRLTLQGCVEQKAMTIVHGINIGISGVTVIIGNFFFLVLFGGRIIILIRF